MLRRALPLRDVGVEALLLGSAGCRQGNAGPELVAVRADALVGPQQLSRFGVISSTDQRLQSLQVLMCMQCSALETKNNESWFCLAMCLRAWKMIVTFITTEFGAFRLRCAEAILTAVSTEESWVVHLPAICRSFTSLFTPELRSMPLTLLELQLPEFGLEIMESLRAELDFFNVPADETLLLAPFRVFCIEGANSISLLLELCKTPEYLVGLLTKSLCSIVFFKQHRSNQNSAGFSGFESAAPMSDFHSLDRPPIYYKVCMTTINDKHSRMGPPPPTKFVSK